MGGRLCSWFFERGGGNDSDSDSDNEVGMTTTMGVCLTFNPIRHQFSV